MQLGTYRGQSKMRLFGALLLVASIQVAAEPGIPIEAISKLVVSYGKTLGCEVHIDKRNIVAYTLGNEEVFVALYSLDLGCSGGTAMSRPAFAAVGRGAYGTLHVRPEYSSPRQTSDDFPQVTYQLFSKRGQLRYRANSLDAKDALCCPSIPVEGTVIFRDGFWIDDTKK
jgi:hypothetical protein